MRGCRVKPAADALKQAVIYLRVSTARQADTDHDPEGYSIPAQREACRRAAAAIDAVVIDEYVDRGESARSIDRPQLQRMLARLEQGGVDYVVVHKLDRLARSLIDDVAINLAMKQAGVELVSASEQINDTPSGKLLHGIMASIAEFYSRNLSQEAAKGLHQKAKMGGTTSRAPLGYLNVRQIVDGREIRTVAVDPERAPFIQWAFEAFSSGRYSIKTLTDALAARGLRTRPSPKRAANALSKSRVQLMLNSRYYLGFTNFRGVEYPGRHEALVTPETFQKVQAVLRAHDNVGERQRIHNHYLKGKLYCSRCGARLCLTHSRGNGGQYFYFFCLNRQRGLGCRQRYMAAEEVEDAVVRYYATVQLEPARITHLREVIFDQLRIQQAASVREAERQDKRLKRLERERRKLLEAYYEADLPIELLKAEQRRINQEVTEAARIVKATQLEASLASGQVTKALKLLEDCHEAYRQAGPQIRRMFNHVFFKALYLEEGDVVRADYADAFAELLADDLAGRLEHEGKNPEKLFAGPGSNKDDLVGATGFEPVTSAV